jgi:hypothetical protein
MSEAEKSADPFLLRPTEAAAAVLNDLRDGRQARGPVRLGHRVLVPSETLTRVYYGANDRR